MVYCVHSNKQSYAHSLENITRSSPTKHPEVLIMPTVFDSPVPDKATEQGGMATIDPADITQLRTAVQTDARTAPQAYIDLIDSRTVEVPLAEWRALMRAVAYLDGRRSFHRNYGADLACEGVRIEVVRQESLP
jgi:hypothetical protein